MASVLTPYKSSDGNNPYTEAQLKVLYKNLEPSSREPGKYTPAERILLQRTFLTFIQEGWTATKAVQRIMALAAHEPTKWPYADLAVFMAWKAYDQDFADAYEVAYAMGTDNLEDTGMELAKAGNASMLQFLLKMRNPGRYAPKTEQVLSGQLAVDHVHTIQLVAAKPEALQIEGEVEHGPRGLDDLIDDVVEAESFNE